MLIWISVCKTYCPLDRAGQGKKESFPVLGLGQVIVFVQFHLTNDNMGLGLGLT